MDTDGRMRMVMQVSADGNPSLTFLDDKSSVIQRLLPAIKL
jgi:hypothetical protein